MSADVSEPRKKRLASAQLMNFLLSSSCTFGIETGAAIGTRNDALDRLGHREQFYNKVAQHRQRLAQMSTAEGLRMVRRQVREVVLCDALL